MSGKARVVHTPAVTPASASAPAAAAAAPAAAAGGAAAVPSPHHLQLPSSAALLSAGAVNAAAAAGLLDHAGLEALGLAQEQARRRESTGSLSSKYWLSLSPQPPKYPFVNVWMPFKVFLVDSKKVIKSGWPLRLTVELVYENGELVPHQSASLEVQGYSSRDTHPPVLSAAGSLDVKLRIATVSMAHEGKGFFLRFSGIPTQEARVPAHVVIMPATTTIFHVIRHRLHITQQPPASFYKDEGGRDKCISVEALLLDEFEHPVQGREVPLKVLLCYEGEECVEVKNQSILKMPLESVPKVDRYGKVSLRVRIEEVSKNHQKQAFVLKIAPDIAYSPDQGDISADVSTPIVVLSKRNKRRVNKRDNIDDDSPEMAPSVAPPSTAPNYPPALYLAAAQQVQQQALFNKGLAAAAAATAGPTSSSLSTVAAANSSLLPSITPTGGLAKVGGGSVQASALPSLSQTSLHGARMAKLTSNDGSVAMLADGSELKLLPSFGDTVSHLIDWAAHVHSLLNKIEWQHVGFEVQEDGQLNLHRPLYRCPGCWSYQDSLRQTGHRDSCMIARLARTYSSHVHTYLQDLLLMTGGSNGAGAAGGMPPPAASAAGNPVALASANSLMAAYSKNISMSSGSPHLRQQFLTQQPSTSGPSGGGVGSMGGLALSHQLSLPRINSLSGPSPPPQSSGGGGGGGGGSGGGQGGGAGLQSSSSITGSGIEDEHQAKRPKREHTSSGGGGHQSSSSSLFPPAPPTDWQNLQALDLPLSSPPPGGLMDRGMSTLSMGLGAGPSASSSGGHGGAGGGGNHHGQDAAGIVGATPFAMLGAFNSGGGGGGGGGDANASGSDELPPHSLLLNRAATSMNGGAGGGGGNNNLSLGSYMVSHAEESAVDAVHVVATEFGFPAFGSLGSLPPPSSPTFTSQPSSGSFPLLGFYQYDESTSFLTFVPLRLFPALRAEQVAGLEANYRALRAPAGGNASSAAAAPPPEQSKIITRAAAITLDKLKEEALLLHYASQAEAAGGWLR